MSARAIVTLVTLVLMAHPALAAEEGEPGYDGYQAFLDHEAHVALAEGDFPRAEALFKRLLRIDGKDGDAMREAGRAAHALGDFKTAERALAGADKLHGGGADPELHYLRGEALIALGRVPEGEAEHDKVVLDLGPTPTDPRGRIWLARIYSRRGDLTRADALYRSALDPDVRSPAYAEVMLYVVEAHIQNKDWKGAETLLRAFLVDREDHVRGRELLAWVLEARGKVGTELTLRAELRSERTDDSARVVDHGRALERSADYSRALATYRQAQTMGALGDLGVDIERMEHRLAPEVAVGMMFADDPTGRIQGVNAAATMRFMSLNRLVLTGSHDVVTAGPLAVATMDDDTAVESGTAWVVFGGGNGPSMAVGGNVHKVAGQDTGAGGLWSLRTPAGKGFELQAAGELRMPWRDSALTLREGGLVDALQVDLYATPFTPRLVFSLSGRVRRLGLAPEDGVPEVHAQQLFGAAGVDYVLFMSPGRTARGELLDENLLWPSTLGQAVVVSYRHYELDSEDPFGTRLVLVERSSVDDISMIIRQVFDSSGMLSGELRGGLGYDQAREVDLWRVGGSVLFSATAATRLSFLYDVTSERGSGITGRRHSGWVSLHVDL